MPTFELPVFWREFGRMRVDADTLEEAVVKVYNELGLPDERSYEESSFQVDFEIMQVDKMYPDEEVQRIQKMYMGEVAAPPSAPVPASSDTRPVEMIVCVAGSGGDSGSWSTMYVRIPLATPEADISRVAVKAAYDELLRDGVENVAHVGVYNIDDPVPEDEEAHEG